MGPPAAPRDRARTQRGVAAAFRLDRHPRGPDRQQARRAPSAPAAASERALGPARGESADRLDEDPGARPADRELTYNYGVDRYDLGGAFGHVAVGVPNVAQACERVRKSGGKVTREAGPVKGGTSVIAFVEDPDGYKIEFIETSGRG